MHPCRGTGWGLLDWTIQVEGGEGSDNSDIDDAKVTAIQKWNETNNDQCCVVNGQEKRSESTHIYLLVAAKINSTWSKHFVSSTWPRAIRIWNTLEWHFHGFWNLPAYIKPLCALTGLLYLSIWANYMDIYAWRLHAVAMRPLPPSKLRKQLNISLRVYLN